MYGSHSSTAFLAIIWLQEIGCSRYDGDDQRFFEYGFKIRQVLDVATLRANNRSKKGNGIIVDLQGNDVYWLWKTQSPSITSCNSEWLELGNTLGLGGGALVATVDPPVLDVSELLFQRDTVWTRYADTHKLQLQKEWGLWKNEPPGLQMRVQTDSRGFVTSGREVIKTNMSVGKEVELF